MTKRSSRGQVACYHRPSYYSPRSYEGERRLFSLDGLAARPRQTETPATRPNRAWAAKTPAAKPQPQLKLQPPAIKQPQQQLLREEPPAAKLTTLVLKRKLTPDQREKLVEDHQPLVESLLKNYGYGDLSPRAEIGLTAAAKIGLIAAAENFEDDRPWQFAAYAREVIVNEIRSELGSYQTVSG